MMRLIWQMFVPGNAYSCWIWSISIAADLAFFAAYGHWLKGSWVDVVFFSLNAYSFDYQRRHAT